MAELKYDKKTGRLLFTKQMKKEYTILMSRCIGFKSVIIIAIGLNKGMGMSTRNWDSKNLAGTYI